MNHIYRSIWNDKMGTFVAVPENAKSAGKKSSVGATASKVRSVSFALKLLAISLMVTFGANSYALPVGGVVSAGSANISSVTGSMTVTQSTKNAAINWQSFNIAKGEAVQFVQPNSNSVALNRVLGADPSSILGILSANGKVFLVNPNGILFGLGAQVNVGGLVASTLNITDSDFMAGRYKFAGNGGGIVLNQGSINADGGYVALLGADVGSNGVISAKLGAVALAAGNAITLDVAGDGLLNVTVNQGAISALVQNGGLIQADGGQVLLTAQAAGTLLQGAVNNTGVIQAQTIENRNGTIRLLSDMQSGTVNLSGKLDASAPNGGDGGFIETSAARVNVADSTVVTAQSAQGKPGTWLIDPNNVTIQAAGANTNVTASPNFTSTNDNAIVTTASIQTALNAGTSVVVSTGTGGTNAQAGDIAVNDTLTWTAVTGPTLTLNAARDVTVSAAITATTGSFAATAGRNVNVNAATETTTGNLTFTAAGDVNLAATTKITTGNLTAIAGGNVNVSAASTVTTGNMVFRGDNDGTGPGAAAGTVAITCGNNCLTITKGNLMIRFNPVSYATTDAEITAYGTHLTGGGVLDAKAWVFGKGDNKLYDGTTAATVSGLKPDLGGATPAAALGTVTNANFDTKNVGTNKLITYNSTFANATYDLFAPFWTAAGTYTTRADILVRPLTVSAVTDSRVYNGITSSVGVPISVGLQPGDTLNGPLTQAYASKNVMGTLGSTLVATGPYTVTDGNGGNNYTVTVNTTHGTISPALLTVTASNVTKAYGQTPTLSGFTTAGLVNGETVASVTEVSPGQVATAQVAGSPYAITPSAATGGTFTSGNYTIGYVNGVLTITPVALIGNITAANKVYDTTTGAVITGRTLAGILGTDVVSYTGGTATFDTPVVVSPIEPPPSVVSPIEPPPGVVPAASLSVVPSGVPVVVLIRTPAQLLSVAPLPPISALPAIALVQPPPFVDLIELPPTVVGPPPPRPRKQDRN